MNLTKKNKAEIFQLIRNENLMASQELLYIYITNLMKGSYRKGLAKGWADHVHELMDTDNVIYRD